MSGILSLNPCLLESQFPPTEPVGRTGRKSMCPISPLLTLGSPILDEGRSALPRWNLSLKTQSVNLDKVSPMASFFNLTPSPTAASTPPPPYFPPPKEKEKDEDKRWVALLERQNKELMGQINVLSSQVNSVLTGKPRSISFHGRAPTTKEHSLHDLQTALRSNILIQKQLATMQEELLRTRRRCAELSEVEAGKRSLELRCLGLERIVEELMSAIDRMKTHPHPPRTTFDEPGSKSEWDVKGLAIQVEDAVRGEDTMNVVGLREDFESFMISTRRKLIPYRLRAVILYILSRLREHDALDQVIGAGIIFMGALMWVSFTLLENGRRFVRKRGIRRPCAVCN